MILRISNPRGNDTVIQVYKYTRDTAVMFLGIGIQDTELKTQKRETGRQRDKNTVALRGRKKGT